MTGSGRDRFGLCKLRGTKEAATCVDREVLGAGIPLFAQLSVSLRVRLVYHPLVCDGRTISAFPTSVGKDLADGERGGRKETCPHHIFSKT